jgi:uroporphyrinogen decarboxylase
MIFDTWGGLLSTPAYQTFSLDYMVYIISRLNREYAKQKIPIILFTKGGNCWLEKIAISGCDAIGLDWTIDIGLARQRLNNKKIALQGNMDPAVLYGNPESIRHEVKNILQSYGNGSGHIFNLGHGISQYTEPDNVKIFIESVREFSPFFHPNV